MRATTWALGMLALACGAAQQPPDQSAKAPSVSVPPPEQAPDPEPAAATGPLVLDVRGERPRWLDAELPEHSSRRPAYDSLLASGDRAAITRTAVGDYFGFHEATGVVGPLALPRPLKKVMFGPADSVLVVTVDGKLHSAMSVKAALSWQGFAPRTAPEKAVSWDSAGDYLVAADDKQVHLSRDGGTSWKSTKRAPWGTPRTVLVRSDGVMAVQGGPAKAPVTFLSRDDGKSWQRSSFQPEHITRSGAFIWSDVWKCNAVLSENGSTWTKDRLERTTRAWTESFRTTPTPEGVIDGAHRALADPPPPRVPPAKDRRTGRGCTPPPRAKGTPTSMGILGALSGGSVGTLFEANGAGLGAIGGLGSAGGLTGAARGVRPPAEPAWGTCRGAGCLRPPPVEPRKTRTRFELFRDGRCADSHAGRMCRDGFERAPHVSIVNEATGERRVAEIPVGCVPRHVTGVAGLGILSCGGPQGLTLHVADSSGAFKEEGSISDEAMTKWSASVQSDGTLMFHEACSELRKCRALVRRPVEPGTRGAFRELSHANAAAYRALPGGRVLVVSRGKSERFVDLFMAEPGKSATALVTGVEVPGDLLEVQLDDAGRVVMRQRLDRSTTETFLVGVDGKRHSP